MSLDTSYEMHIHTLLFNHLKYHKMHRNSVFGIRCVIFLYIFLTNLLG